MNYVNICLTIIRWNMNQVYPNQWPPSKGPGSSRFPIQFLLILPKKPSSDKASPSVSLGGGLTTHCSSHETPRLDHAANAISICLLILRFIS